MKIPASAFTDNLFSPGTAEYLFFIFFGYLSGSVLYAYLLPRLIKHIDIRELSGDGNPGTANAFIHAGVPIGILAIILELAKGFLPVWLALKTLPPSGILFAFVLAAPVVGHAFPVFWKGKHGGKSIAVSFGALLGLYPNFTPALTLAFFYLLFSLILIIRPHLFRSVLTFLCFCLTCLFFGEHPSIVAGCCIIAVLVIVKHFAAYRGERFSICFLRGARQ